LLSISESSFCFFSVSGLILGYLAHPWQDCLNSRDESFRELQMCFAVLSTTFGSAAILMNAVKDPYQKTTTSPFHVFAFKVLANTKPVSLFGGSHF
jgi:hypothetical protein